MLNFELYNPVRVIFGPGEAENIGKYTKEYGTKAMLVTYDVHDFFNALLAKLDKSFKEAGVTVTEFFKVKPNPRLSDIEEAVAICKKEGIEVIIHTILGLPGESTDDILKTMEYLNQMDIQGIKLQLLHILKGTELGRIYLEQEKETEVIRPMAMEEYIDLVIACVEHL